MNCNSDMHETINIRGEALVYRGDVMLVQGHKIDPKQVFGEAQKYTLYKTIIFKPVIPP